MKKKYMLICSTLVIAMAAITMTGCRGQNQTAKSSSAEASVAIVNSYDNTEELATKYPVINPTQIDTHLAKKIQNRLLSGFENWNRGYDAWAKWGNILYTNDSHYNVHGVRLTMDEYKASMNMSLKTADIQMGNFNNMIISGDWAAIRYDITNTNRQTGKSVPGTVMEFVKFKDYGNDLGVRVVEGWAGTKGEDFDAMSGMQTDEEKVAQQKALNSVVNATIPDTNDLEEKYPVTNPTPIKTEEAKKIQSAILNDFDNWNQGYDTWAKWADAYYDTNLQYHTDKSTLTLTEYKDSVKKDSDATDVKRINFDNMLISGDWAAIHYRVTNTDKITGKKTARDAMQFLHFAIKGDKVKLIECWTK
ncbi:nuclear transport factor 2 family protein [Paenibacillus kribbensis]|uniref:nuclear transport factor 2 family protein n=1 Tax=Paenibacillus kribbensis TaxID=172713 RepID=UPI002DBE6154|nr:nuclear transport factor 2 family protein [Paenibacillus kribbensis]MEC0234832.1 nuclear transport factor 2 family protein [Paenibacillus kribbensis]